MTGDEIQCWFYSAKLSDQVMTGDEIQCWSYSARLSDQVICVLSVSNGLRQIVKKPIGRKAGTYTLKKKNKKNAL